MLHKVHRNDPLVIPASTAVSMATNLGAKALGLGQVTGILAPGFKADITLFNMHAPHWYPRHDRTSLLTYSASAADVHTVIVDGKVLLDNRQLTTIDEEKMIAEVQKRGMRLIR
jgi:5-methylthioadenosine/S-adenosylhomocysteine deaminase